MDDDEVVRRINRANTKSSWALAAIVGIAIAVFSLWREQSEIKNAVEDGITETLTNRKETLKNREETLKNREINNEILEYLKQIDAREHEGAPPPAGQE